ncbi:MAG: 3-dehydroquinate synthase [Phycisphaerae bacterium]
MKTVPVQLGSRSYEIRIRSGAIADLPDVLNQIGAARIVGIVDECVLGLHRDRITAVFADRVPFIAVPPGEGSKSLAQAEKIYQKLATERVGRDGVIVAIGGGVVGDLAGFVAATWMRGVRFIQVPTTLEAAIDAAVGGKTGVNLPQGKNLVGAFHQPEAVLVDLNFFDTLSQRDWIAGLAESVKHAAIRDADFFTWHEANASAILQRDAAIVEELVARNCAIKAEVVGKDERESGIREILNYGHTIGHAIEKNAEYALRHGECVALGMVAENQLAVARGLLQTAEAERIEALLRKFVLPTRLAVNLAPETIVESCKLDKKNKVGQIRFALVDRIGNAIRVENVAETEILAAIRALA